MSTPEDPLLEGLKPADLLQRGLDSLKPPSGPGSWVPPKPEELAQLLPQYAIECLIGRGGMGAVYRGKQTALDRPIAIKLLPAELANDAEFTGRFKREARTLARLQHPGIVSVYDFGQTAQGHLYFVMEYVDGTDLHRIIHGPGLKPEQVLEIVAQVCEALQYAHSHGVMHRDIKPANLLLTTDGRAKLADFGLARPMNEESGSFTRSNIVMGTPDYIAPEQLYGHADHRADLFSLGVMLYEMLTGQTPRGAWMPPSKRVRVDVRLDRVVVRALQQDVSLRYQQASEMKTDVDQIRFTPLPGTLPAQVTSLPPAAKVPTAAPGPQPKPIKPPAPGNRTPIQRRKKSGMGLFWAVTLPLMLLAGAYGWLSRRYEVSRVPEEQTAASTENSPEGIATSGLQEVKAVPEEKPKTATPQTSLTKNASPLPPPLSSIPAQPVVTARELTVPISDWLKDARQKGGRLKIFGTWRDQALSLGKAIEFDDFVQVAVGEHGWAARRKGGETYACAWPNLHLAPFKTKDLRAGHMVSLLEQLGNGGLGYRTLWLGETLRRDEVTHPQASICLHPYQLVLALNPEGKILKTTEWGSNTKKGPPADFFEGFNAVAASQDVCVVAKPGKPVEGWDITLGTRTTFPASTLNTVALDSTNQSVILLTSSGSPQVFSLPPRESTVKEQSIPPGLAPVISVKAGRTLYAAQRPDGTWRAWGNSPELIGLTERNGRMLDVDYDFQPGLSRIMLWIEPVSDAERRTPTIATPTPSPKPVQNEDDVAQRLSMLAAQFQTAYDRDILALHHTAVAELDGKYLAAVQRAMDAASSAGQLDEAVKLREEIKRIRDKQALPSYDFETLPESLKKLRFTYRDALTKLIVSRKSDSQPLYDRYEQLLADYQTELTQQKRLDEAVRVKKAREDLSHIRTQNAPPQIGTSPAPAPATQGIALFDGRTLNNWRIEGDKSAFSVTGGLIKAAHQKGSLISTIGPWKNFELNLKVMTEIKGNSGVWIHTARNPSDDKPPGVEVQICNNGIDTQKTGSLHGIKPLTNQLVSDGQWFSLKIIVQDKTIRVFLNGTQINEWTQPDGWRPPPNSPNASLGSGSIGLQSHSGIIWFKDIYIRSL
ncbi:Serine/threonine protein kinase [Prosthecobacter debontii]|uniref:Serine/threonine protein kinase n=1 Tax=Prosthecobacter debontii TaxID=48467 RepID=A0A1T4YCN6_9BACT|nr:family 16 glycoside hydrolase [Prosthecobacter debontii]SKA99288.1 Serine/threonine protein kinase [Prosthecobacter debontii]